jgi:hypothetical protein
MTRGRLNATEDKFDKIFSQELQSFENSIQNNRDHQINLLNRSDSQETARRVTQPSQTTQNRVSTVPPRARSSTPVTQRVNCSPVWDHGSKFEYEGRVYIKCRHCDYKTVYSSTSTFSSHLRSAHTILLGLESDNGELGDNAETMSRREQLVLKILLKMIITGFLPFRLVENQHFRDFCHLLNKSFKVPCRKTISGKIKNYS